MHRDTARISWKSEKYFCLELTRWVYTVISANTERQDKNPYPDS